MNVKRIDHIGIAVADLGEAKAFIESLGIECAADFEHPGWLKAGFYPVGDSAIALLYMEEPEVNARRLKGEPLTRLDHVCFEVDNLDETVSYLKSEGVATHGGEWESPDSASLPETSAGGTRSVFTEPETSSGFAFQFVEVTGGGSVAADLAAIEEPAP